jgi:hypothetical protein
MAAADSTGVIDHARTTPLSAADIAAHEAASFVRPLARRVPVGRLSAAELSVTTEIAYLERERQDATQLAYELAAGGEEW